VLRKWSRIGGGSSLLAGSEKKAKRKPPEKLVPQGAV